MNTHKITNNQTGLEILVEVTRSADIYSIFEAKIEGSTRTNSFNADEWTVEELPAQLPTEVGTVVRFSKWAGLKRDYVALLTNGGWHLDVDATAYMDSAHIQSEVNAGLAEFEVIFEP